MDGILNFAKDYYIVLLIIGGVFLLALIGYLYDRYQNRDIKISKDENNTNEVVTEQTMQGVQQTAPQPQAQTQPPEEEVPQINGLE